MFSPFQVNLSEIISMTEISLVQPGRYRHFKGNEYQVLGVATHSESLAPLVVYRPLYGERKLWVRPLAMFQEKVDVGGEWVPRFELIEADQ